MEGFFYSNAQGNFNLLNELQAKNEIVSEDYYIGDLTVNKFKNDEVFFDDVNYTIILKGFVLNRTILLELYKKEWVEILICLFEKDKGGFPNNLRGSFFSLIIDKKNNKQYFYTDQICSKHLYFYSKNDIIVVTSSLNLMYHILRTNALKYELNLESCYMLLSYGYMLNNNTLSNDIKKIEPGCCLKIYKNEIEVESYYKLSSKKDNSPKTDDQYIEEIDSKFREAVKLQFDKDSEYSFNHLVGLSGGLDSRMTCWVAHKMGYINQTNFTFSQSNYLDEVIPKEIAKDLKHQWIFKFLDNGNFLYDIDEVNRVAGGNVLYFSLAHTYNFFKQINFGSYGIIHTGQLGDVVIGSFIRNFDPNQLSNVGSAYSNKLLNKITDTNEKYENFDELEIAKFYQRGFNGANNGLLSANIFSETYSPFYNLDFIEYCLSIPIKHRMNHNIYKKWILKKYPEAAHYIWESTKQKIHPKKIKLKIKGNEFTLEDLKTIFLRKFKFLQEGMTTEKHMNPIDYWYTNNLDLKNRWDNYFHSNIENLNFNESLKVDCEHLYLHGSAIEKTQVLTLLSSIKLYYS